MNKRNKDENKKQAYLKIRNNNFTCFIYEWNVVQGLSRNAHNYTIGLSGHVRKYGVILIFCDCAYFAVGQVALYTVCVVYVVCVVCAVCVVCVV